MFMHTQDTRGKPEPCRTFQVWQLSGPVLQNFTGLAANSAEKFNFGSIFARNQGIFAAKVEKFCKSGLMFDRARDKMDGAVRMNPIFSKIYPPHPQVSLDGNSPKTLISLYKYRPHFTEGVDGKRR